MLKNYLKIAFRNIKKNKGYSLINIIGLAFGMTCFILIALWVIDELSYDRFHKNIDRLYRVNAIEESNKIVTNSSLRLGKELKERYPEIEAYTNFIPWARSLVKYGNKSYDEHNIYLVDPEFFTMFSIEFLAGDPLHVLKDKYSIVITEKTAKKYFGDEYPIGKQVYSDVYQRDFTVLGVIKELPENSTFKFNIAASIDLMPQQRMESWEFSGWTYVILRNNASKYYFNEKFKDFYRKYVNSEWNIYPELQDFASIHLYGDGNTGLVKLVYIFSVIAIFILVIAFINFMNLSTARATKRTLEVGIRKVNGALKRQLIFQFLCEAIIIAFIALLFAIILVEFLLPFFNKFSYKNLNFIGGNIIPSLLGLVGLAFLTGIVSGIYPAFILSSFKPISALKEKSGSGRVGSTFRRILTVGQFAISIGLIICTIIVREQLQYIQKKDIGLNKDMVLTLNSNPDLNKTFDSYKSELLKYSDIENVSASATYPFEVNQGIDINWEGHLNEDARLMNYTMVDYDFFSTFDFKFIQGRAFSKEYQTDSTEACIINESALSMMGFEDPIGKYVNFGHPAFPEEKRNARIIGVVKDFHYRSLHYPVGPFIFKMYRPWHFNIFIKVNPENILKTITSIETITKKFAPDYPFAFEFLDDSYNRLYIVETKVGTMFNVFAIIAILISCLGLLGLASFTTEQKTKEIGIRKVLGSTVTGIIFMLSKEFIKWVLLANVIAWPIAYYFSDKWLSDFAYRIDISVWIFIASGIIALIIALLTVGYQAVRAATANPIDSLRYE